MSTIIWGDFPEPIQTNHNIPVDTAFQNPFKNFENPLNIGDSATISAIKDFMGFINDVKEYGLSHAIFGKPFAQVLTDGLVDFVKAVAVFVTGNGDLFFLMPAIVIITATFLIGRNKYTKWIIPMLFAYGVSRVFFRLLLQGGA